VDVEKDGLVSFGLARELADHLGARYTRIEELKAADLVKAVREADGNTIFIFVLPAYPCSTLLTR